MAKLRLTLACWDYDRTKALMDGSVQPEGIELNYIPTFPTETFWRMVRYQEFDASEMSLSYYSVLRSRGETDFIAIPVFPSRYFRHSCIYVNADAGIERPEDLAGKRFGFPDYPMTAAVWIRGMLQHEYGLSLQDIRWVVGGQEEPGRDSTVPESLPKGVSVESIPPDKTLAAMLEAGEIDALGTPNMPSPFLRKSPRVRRLFPDSRKVEMDYYRKTGIFPIMHTLVVKEAIYQAHPWVAQSLYKAFEEAKQRCLNDLYQTEALKYTIPWLIDEVEQAQAILGDDPWPYGFEANQATIETLTGYLLEQGLTQRKVDPEELFAPSTLKQYKV